MPLTTRTPETFIADGRTWFLVIDRGSRGVIYETRTTPNLITTTTAENAAAHAALQTSS